MNSMKKSIRRVFWMLVLCLFFLLGYMGKLILIDRDEISTHSRNSRLNYSDDGIRRGEILDRDGEVLGTSTLQADGSYSREYPFGETAVHVTGYSSKGKAGIEAIENFELITLKNEVAQRLGNIFLDKELIGNSVRLTIDMAIQEKAGELLGNAKGAIVVMQPSTGQILALQSYPNFDPNRIGTDWESLKKDENSPLVNRSTQGLYPPGSTFKLITALSIMREIEDWDQKNYICEGVANFENKVIHCYDDTIHGEIGLKEALAQSCNCYFAQMAVEISSSKLRDTMVKSAMIEENYFELPYSENKIGLEKTSNESELVEISIGQGKMAVTPLYMAMLVSGIANEGIMMEPYIVENAIDKSGNAMKQKIPKKIAQIASIEESATLTDMMISVIEDGTGQGAAIEGVSIAGKTGTAQNSTGKDHSWFVAFAPVENPQIAIAVVIEDKETYGSAVTIAKQMMEMALKEVS